MSPSEIRATLLTRLAAETAAWQALLNLLEQEEHALVEGAADRLPPLNTSKLAQLQTLGNLARARREALAAAGREADHAGMGGWLEQNGEPEHRSQWQRLCDMEQQAQAMNERIGALIELRLSSTRQALNVLVHAATRKNGLYDQDGLAVPGQHGKPLTAA
jgi:flagella synthesis protein FlgN